MPKDEFDFNDPFELNGVTLRTAEDTTGQMAECFVEEFLRLGCDHHQILALFHDPQYLGPSLVLERHGAGFIRELIAEVFLRRGRQVTWESADGLADMPAASHGPGKSVVCQ